MSKRRRRTRADDVFDTICRIALENCGAAPNSRVIAAALGLSQSRVQQLLMRLQIQGRITYIDRYTYRVEQSSWEPPPYTRVLDVLSPEHVHENSVCS